MLLPRPVRAGAAVVAGVAGDLAVVCAAVTEALLAGADFALFVDTVLTATLGALFLLLAAATLIDFFAGVGEDFEAPDACLAAADFGSFAGVRALVTDATAPDAVGFAELRAPFPWSEDFTFELEVLRRLLWADDSLAIDRAVYRNARSGSNTTMQVLSETRVTRIDPCPRPRRVSGFGTLPSWIRWNASNPSRSRVGALCAF